VQKEEALITMNTNLDVRRHAELFDPHTFNTPVTIIGAGATGSWLAIALAKLGIDNISIWDFDKVEEHNIPNQAFGIR
jgi:tRNA A37 threonylcarbamoyladenosine dehydratase